MTLCTTGLQAATKKRCAEIVRRLGGSYSGDLTKDVTHLVATEWGSAKYRKAAELNLEVVRPEWVYACEEAAASGGEAPRGAAFRLPYFQGCCVTVSGALEREERMTLQAEVESAGGKWLPSLTSETRPLAVTKPEGSKHDAAKEAGIPIVSLQWCWACVEERRPIEFDTFKPSSSDDAMPPFRSGWRGGWLPARAVAADDTAGAGAGAGAGAAAGAGAGAGADAGAPAGSPTETRKDKLAKGAGGTSPTAAPTEEDVDPADAVRVDIAETVQGHYLDSCQIHLHGFAKREMKSLVQLIRRGGATRLDQPDSNVTHVVASVRASMCAPRPARVYRPI